MSRVDVLRIVAILALLACILGIRYLLARPKSKPVKPRRDFVRPRPPLSEALRDAIETDMERARRWAREDRPPRAERLHPVSFDGDIKILGALAKWTYRLQVEALATSGTPMERVYWMVDNHCDICSGTGYVMESRYCPHPARHTIEVAPCPKCPGVYIGKDA